MTNADIINNRLINQQIATTAFTKPEEIVSWLVAMQAQEYAMSKWAIGLRLRGLTDTGVEKAFKDGAILRTHLMRPTWHFVTPADIVVKTTLFRSLNKREEQAVKKAVEEYVLFAERVNG